MILKVFYIKSIFNSKTCKTKNNLQLKKNNKSVMLTLNPFQVGKKRMSLSIRNNSNS